MSLESALIVSAVLFSIGLYGALSKRSAIAVLMCVELMFNAVNLAAVAFSRYAVRRRSPCRPRAGASSWRIRC